LDIVAGQLGGQRNLAVAGLPDRRAEAFARGLDCAAGLAAYLLLAASVVIALAPLRPYRLFAGLVIAAIKAGLIGWVYMDPRLDLGLRAGPTR